MLHSATAVSPFYANKGYNPQLTLSLKDILSHVTHKVAKDLWSLHQFLWDKINTANQAYSKHANAQHKSTPNWPPGTLTQSKQLSISRVKGARSGGTYTSLLYALRLPHWPATPHATSPPLPGPPLPLQLLAGPLPTALPMPPAALSTSTTPAPPENPLQSSTWPPPTSAMLHPSPLLLHHTPARPYHISPQLSKPPPHTMPAVRTMPLLAAARMSWRLLGADGNPHQNSLPKLPIQGSTHAAQRTCYQLLLSWPLAGPHF
ncbi:hypothetical protein E4T56_gene2800 [Termitomyces sp. T112]|nr:hypothetical protein E4T56_gene2800 [Termitomyces sp. T112]